MKIVGRALDRASFVEDYVQLFWKDATLIAYTWPTVSRQGLLLKPGSSGYNEAVFALEGQYLLDCRVLPDQVDLVFSKGSELSISLRDSDYVGLEALLFSDSDQSLWIV